MNRRGGGIPASSIFSSNFSWFLNTLLPWPAYPEVSLINELLLCKFIGMQEVVQISWNALI